MLVDAATGEWADLARLEPTSDWLSIIAFHDQYQRSATIWSPTSDALVYTSERNGGKPGVYVIAAAEGAEAELIAEGTLAFWSMAGSETLTPGSE